MVLTGTLVSGVVGSGIGKGLDELVKMAQGFHDKGFGEELKALFGPEAAINMIQPGASRAIGQAFKTKGLGVTEQSSRMARETMSEGARPPIGSAATEASGLEARRQLSKAVSGDPYREQNVKWLEDRIMKFLVDSGLEPHDAKLLVDEMWTGSSAVEGKFAAQSIVDAAQRQHTSLDMLANEHMAGAKALTDQVEKLIEGWSKSAPRQLGVDLGTTLLKARAQFSKDMSAVAKSIHEMIGGPVVPADDAIATAQKLMAVSPPDSLPAFVTGLAALKPGSRLTIEEAHNYRTFAREAERAMTRGGNMTPGSDYHYFRELENSIDDSISAVAAQSKGDVGSALKKFDSRYKEGIVTFKNGKVREIINRIQKGEVPEPHEVARDILEAGSMQDVQAIKKYLTPDQIENVGKAFTDNLFRASSTEASIESPKLVLNPNALLRNIEKYQDVMRTFGMSPKFVGELREFANSLRARNGKLDPEFLRQGPIRQKLAEWKEAQRVLDDFVDNNPLAAFRSGNAAAKDAALSCLANPANKERIKPVVQALLPVERQDVQIYNMLRLFGDTMETTPERLKQVGGKAIKNWLGRYTEEQQNALLGYGLAKDLARLGDKVNVNHSGKIKVQEAKEYTTAELRAMLDECQ